MYLEMIRPFVTFCTGPMNEGKPQLEVRAWLRCPHCFNIADFTSSATVLRPETWKDNDKTTNDLIEGLRYAALTQLKQHRVCENCGIVSAWPAKDQDKGKKALDIMITLDTLRQRTAALTSAVAYKTVLGRDIERRIAKDIAKARQEMGLGV